MNGTNVLRITDWLRRLSAMLAIMLVSCLILVACAQPAAVPEAAQPDATEEAPIGDAEVVDPGALVEPVQVGEVSLSDIADDPASYVGQWVTVRGEVSEALTPEVFRLDEDNLLNIGDEILVVHEQGAAQALEDGAEVVVTGRVRNFVLADVERELGIDLDQQLEVEYSNRPTIVATTIEMMEAP